MDTPPELTTLPAGPAIAVRDQVAMTELPAFFSTAFHDLAEVGGDQLAGPPFAIYHSLGAARIDVEAVMPLRAPVTPTGHVHTLDLAGGPAVQVRHVGAYGELGPAYEAVERWLDEHARARAGAIREVYVTGPSGRPNEQVTLVVQPLVAA